MVHPEHGEPEGERVKQTSGEVQRVSGMIVQLRESGALRGNCENLDVHPFEERERATCL